MAVGAALIIVAFGEKLASPDMALQFLDQQPQFNVAQGIGLESPTSSSPASRAGWRSCSGCC